VTALIAAVFLASLLGSMHCAGMCGAFLAFAVAGDPADAPAPSKATLHAAYNGGRLITYTLLGAAAGLLGAALDLGGSLAGLQNTAAILAGSLMVGFGLVAILRSRGVRIPHMPLPMALRSAVARGHRAALGRPPVARAAAIGLLTTLLPCGWLYAFVITAAGTANPLLGALTMAAFWAGTLPIMLSLGVGLQSLTGSLRKRLPLLTSLLLVGVGLFTIAGRLAIPAFAAPQSSPQDAPSTTAELTAHVHTLDASESPCCDPKKP